MYKLYLPLSLLTELGARDKFLLLRSPSSLVRFARSSLEEEGSTMDPYYLQSVTVGWVDFYTILLRIFTKEGRCV